MVVIGAIAFYFKHASMREVIGRFHTILVQRGVLLGLLLIILSLGNSICNYILNLGVV